MYVSTWLAYLVGLASLYNGVTFTILPHHTTPSPTNNNNSTTHHVTTTAQSSSTTRPDLTRTDFTNMTALATNDRRAGPKSARRVDDDVLMSRVLQEAAQHGLNMMKELFEEREPMLYHQGSWLSEDEPGHRLSEFSAPRRGAILQARLGYAALAAAKRFKQTFPDAEGRASPLRASLRRTPLEGLCPPRFRPRCRPATRRYRTHDGTCNTDRQPRWGSAMMPAQRFLPPAYDDGVESIRRSVDGRSLPAARLISLHVHSSRDVEGRVSLLLMQWGQFVDHDLTATAQQRGFNNSVPRCCEASDDPLHPACLPIFVPPDDPWLNHLGINCLEFTRSGPAVRQDCSLGWREQVNQVTAYLDASTIYSSNARTADDIRGFTRGQLLMGGSESVHDPCRRAALSGRCIKPGDSRSSEQPGLLAMHTAMAEEHNRIALTLSGMNQHWSDEKTYQETRRIIGAMVQHITYREFLPLVLGPEVVRLFDLELLPGGFYDRHSSKVNPGIANSFASAAFRFGHSLVQNSYMRCDVDHQFIFNNVSLHDEQSGEGDQGTPFSLHRLLRGMANQRTQRRDEFITEELTQHLFQTPRFPFGLDLAAINIQRGRDHGIPAYVDWRSPCGLGLLDNWEDLEPVMGIRSVQRLQRAYRDIRDIDLYTGGLSERPVLGGLVGPTFACIIAQQFSNTRRGDRFWYENGNFESSFTPAQLQSIRRTSLAQILCNTFGGTLQPNVMLPPGPKNERHLCGESPLAPINLRPWLEHNLSFNNGQDKNTNSGFDTTSSVDPVTPSFTNLHNKRPINDQFAESSSFNSNVNEKLEGINVSSGDQMTLTVHHFTESILTHSIDNKLDFTATTPSKRPQKRPAPSKPHTTVNDKLDIPTKHRPIAVLRPIPNQSTTLEHKQDLTNNNIRHTTEPNIHIQVDFSDVQDEMEMKPHGIDDKLNLPKRRLKRPIKTKPLQQNVIQQTRRHGTDVSVRQNSKQTALITDNTETVAQTRFTNQDNATGYHDNHAVNHEFQQLNSHKTITESYNSVNDSLDNEMENKQTQTDNYPDGYETYDAQNQYDSYKVNNNYYTSNNYYDSYQPKKQYMHYDQGMTHKPIVDDNEQHSTSLTNLQTFYKIGTTEHATSQQPYYNGPTTLKPDQITYMIDYVIPNGNVKNNVYISYDINSNVPPRSNHDHYGLENTYKLATTKHNYRPYNTVPNDYVVYNVNSKPTNNIPVLQNGDVYNRPEHIHDYDYDERPDATNIQQITFLTYITENRNKRPIGYDAPDIPKDGTYKQPNYQTYSNTSRPHLQTENTHTSPTLQTGNKLSFQDRTYSIVNDQSYSNTSKPYLQTENINVKDKNAPRPTIENSKLSSFKDSTYVIENYQTYRDTSRPYLQKSSSDMEDDNTNTKPTSKDEYTDSRPNYQTYGDTSRPHLQKESTDMNNDNINIKLTSQNKYTESRPNYQTYGDTSRPHLQKESTDMNNDNINIKLTSQNKYTESRPNYQTYGDTSRPHLQKESTDMNNDNINIKLTSQNKYTESRPNYQTYGDTSRPHLQKESTDMNNDNINIKLTSQNKYTESRPNYQTYGDTSRPHLQKESTDMNNDNINIKLTSQNKYTDSRTNYQTYSDTSRPHSQKESTDLEDDSTKTKLTSQNEYINLKYSTQSRPNYQTYSDTSRPHSQKENTDLRDDNTKTKLTSQNEYINLKLSTESRPNYQTYSDTNRPHSQKENTDLRGDNTNIKLTSQNEYTDSRTNFQTYSHTSRPHLQIESTDLEDYITKIKLTSQNEYINFKHSTENRPNYQTYSHTSRPHLHIESTDLEDDITKIKLTSQNEYINFKHSTENRPNYQTYSRTSRPHLQKGSTDLEDDSTNKKLTSQNEYINLKDSTESRPNYQTNSNTSRPHLQIENTDLRDDNTNIKLTSQNEYMDLKDSTDNRPNYQTYSDTSRPHSQNENTDLKDDNTKTKLPSQNEYIDLKYSTENRPNYQTYSDTSRPHSQNENTDLRDDNNKTKPTSQNDYINLVDSTESRPNYQTYSDTSRPHSQNENTDLRDDNTKTKLMSQNEYVDLKDSTENRPNYQTYSDTSRPHSQKENTDLKDDNTNIKLTSHNEYIDLKDSTESRPNYQTYSDTSRPHLQIENTDLRDDNTNIKLTSQNEYVNLFKLSTESTPNYQTYSDTSRPHSLKENTDLRDDNTNIKLTSQNEYIDLKDSTESRPNYQTYSDTNRPHSQKENTDLRDDNTNIRLTSQNEYINFKHSTEKRPNYQAYSHTSRPHSQKENTDLRDDNTNIKLTSQNEYIDLKDSTESRPNYQTYSDTNRPHSQKENNDLRGDNANITLTSQNEYINFIHSTENRPNYQTYNDTSRPHSQKENTDLRDDNTNKKLTSQNEYVILQDSTESRPNYQTYSDTNTPHSQKENTDVRDANTNMKLTSQNEYTNLKDSTGSRPNYQTHSETNRPHSQKESTDLTGESTRTRHTAENGYIPNFDSTDSRPNYGSNQTAYINRKVQLNNINRHILEDFSNHDVDNNRPSIKFDINIYTQHMTVNNHIPTTMNNGTGDRLILQYDDTRPHLQLDQHVRPDLIPDATHSTLIATHTGLNKQIIDIPTLDYTTHESETEYGPHNYYYEQTDLDNMTSTYVDKHNTTTEKLKETDTITVLNSNYDGVQTTMDTDDDEQNKSSDVSFVLVNFENEDPNHIISYISNGDLINSDNCKEIGDNFNVQSRNTELKGGITADLVGSFSTKQKLISKPSTGNKVNIELLPSETEPDLWVMYEESPLQPPLPAVPTLGPSTDPTTSTELPRPLKRPRFAFF